MVKTFNILHYLCLGLILYIFPLKSFSQPLRKMAINASGDAGFQQQKLSLGYEKEIFKYSRHLQENEIRQIFMGLGFGVQNYNTLQNFYLPPGLVVHAYGYNISLFLTMASTEPKILKPQKRKHNFITFRVGINEFSNVRAYYQNYDQSGYSDIDKVYNPKCNSFDYEILMGRLIKLNSHNYLRLGLNAGIRVGHVSGVRYHHGILNPNDPRFREMLSPFILNLSLGYQFQFGKLSKIKKK